MVNYTIEKFEENTHIKEDAPVMTPIENVLLVLPPSSVHIPAPFNKEETFCTDSMRFL